MNQKSAARKIPNDLLKRYTMNGKIEVRNVYFNQILSEVRRYTIDDIEKMINSARNNQTSYYGQTDSCLYEAMKSFELKDTTLAVIGSQTPWYESIALSRGVKKCLTVEYQEIYFEHPAIEVRTPNELKDIDVDFGISISSLEHSGLGRYGDPLDPDGDIAGMQNLKSVLNKDGILFLSVPIGKDKLVWNAHRIYGNTRFPKLIEGWELVNSYGFSDDLLSEDTGHDAKYQPVFVLRNK